MGGLSTAILALIEQTALLDSVSTCGKRNNRPGKPRLFIAFSARQTRISLNRKQRASRLI